MMLSSDNFDVAAHCSDLVVFQILNETLNIIRDRYIPDQLTINFHDRSFISARLDFVPNNPHGPTFHSAQATAQNCHEPESTSLHRHPLGSATLYHQVFYQQPF